MRQISQTGLSGAWLVAACLVLLGWATPTWAVLTITPITWNVVGLDSNSPTTGPFQFPVGARICAVGAASTGAVTATFAFKPFVAHTGVTNGDTACAGGTPCVTLRTASLDNYSIGALSSGACQDAYFEVEVKKENAAYNTGRLYTITAVDTVPANAVSTPQPRELFVEHLISQNRNSVQNVSYSGALANANVTFPTPLASMSSTSAGGTFGLAVGGIYDIRLDASTATQGYEQLETFANFSNAVFRILKVESTYTANTSPTYPAPSPLTTTSFLYANGCDWQLSPVLPNYLSCQGTGKTGGTISATYRIQVLTVPGGTTSALNTLIYDYSGSSFHYNSDTSVGGRTIVIVDPLTATFSKAFVPASINPNGVSRLTFTIGNPNVSTVTGYNFSDVLPSGLLVAATPNAATVGCGSPTVTATAGTNTIALSGASALANSSCTLAVDVTGAAVGTYLNGTAPNALVELFVNATTTGKFATSTLTIGTARPPVPSGSCPLASQVTIASATFGGTGSANSQLTRHASAPGSTLSFTNVQGGDSISTTVGNGVNSWQGTGFNITDTTYPVEASHSYYEISIDSTNFRNIQLTFDGRTPGSWASNSNPTYVSTSIDGGAFTLLSSGLNLLKNGFSSSGALTATTSGLTTVFRIEPTGTSGGGGNPDFTATAMLDNISVVGCPFVTPPTITKAFSPTTIGVTQNSTLTFTLVNTSTSALTGVAVSDTMPAGLTVVSAVQGTPSCNGTISTAPAGTVSLTGGTLAAGVGQTCKIVVTVTGATSGLKDNTSGPISAIESGTNTGASGIATAQLRVVDPPTISKTFTNSPIAAGTDSGLRFTVTNPNSAYTMVSVGFTDTFPVSPGAMVVAPTPAATNGCGGTWTTTAGAGSVTLAGVTLAPGASCSVSVYVRAPAAGTYNNTSGNVSHVINSATLNGNTASASLVARTPVVSIGLQKRVGLSATGPWGEFASLPLNGNVYYQFSIENTGDVVLSRPGSGSWITDPSIPGSPFCNNATTVPGASPATLAVGDYFDCVAGPITASQTSLTNTATATGVNGGTTVTDTDTATYTTKLPDLDVSKTKISPASPVDVTSAVTVVYRISVLNKTPASTVNDTLAPIVVEDTLRSGITYLSFTSPDPYWSCSLVQTAPLHKVQCTYSGQLVVGVTTTIDLTVRVAAGTGDLNNTAVALYGGDPACTDPNPTPDTECKGPFNEGTVPVSLSDVSVAVDGGQLVVDFGTAAQAGTLGFRVLADSAASASRLPISDALVVADGSTLAPKRFQARGPYTGQTRVWIEEVAVNSAKTLYGPYPVGSSTGERDLVVGTNWAAIANEQRAFRRDQARAIVTRGNATGLEAELRLSTTGWATVSYADLIAQGIDWSGMAPGQIRLSHGSESVPVSYRGPAVVGPGSEFSFLGEAVDGSLYTKTSVYRLAVGTARPLETAFAGVGRLIPRQAVADRFEYAPNRGYDFASPIADPWYARRAIRVNAPSAAITENFVLPEKAPGSTGERIEVELWGGLDFPTAPDHSVRLSLNGTVFAARQFDGVRRELVVADLPPNLLVSGNNVFTLELIGDTGVFADITYLEAIRIDYTRRTTAADDRFAFSAGADVAPAPTTAPDEAIFVSNFDNEGASACAPADSGCAAYRVTGLSTPAVVVLRARDGEQAQQLSGVSVTPGTAGYDVSFASAVRPGDRYWVQPEVGAAAIVASATPIVDPLAGDRATYLIVSHPSFISGLAPLVAARQAEGFSVRVIDVEDLYRYYSRGSVDPVAIGTALANAYRQLGTRYVLLVGGDTYDYFNYGGSNSQSFIPTNYQTTSAFVHYAPVDSPFADFNGDGLVDMAIGRFPVRTRAELDAVIAKTLAYSQANHAHRFLQLSDRNQGDLSFGGQLSQVPTLLGAPWQITGISLQDYPGGSAGVALARSDIVAAVNSGQSLLSFFGHSSPSSWSRESLITAPLVYSGMFSNASMPTFVWQFGCYGTYFVDPNYNSIAHGLMLQSNGGGAAAVLGASALTEISSDMAWMTALTPLLETERVGDALRLGQRAMHTQGPHLRDVSDGGVLLGDPALRIRQ